MVDSVFVSCMPTYSHSPSVYEPKLRCVRAPSVAVCAALYRTWKHKLLYWKTDEQIFAYLFRFFLLIACIFSHSPVVDVFVVVCIACTLMLGSYTRSVRSHHPIPMASVRCLTQMPPLRAHNIRTGRYGCVCAVNRLDNQVIQITYTVNCATMCSSFHAHM